MSSSQPFLPSSQLSVAGQASKKSKFTYKHLSLLRASSATCPLRVVAHIDLDAFYAQCEMVRLGVDEDQPLAVQQWGALIAINYPARKYGLSRMIAANEAKKLCPDLILQHVATWKEGDDRWAYRDDADADIHTQKVSLDPYRLESRRILACIKEHLPPPPVQRVEKASVDEVFLDLSKQVHTTLLERYPELARPPPYDDPSERLPRPPTTALDWDADALVDLDETQTEDDDPDWDDMAMLIGSEIVRGVRRRIFEVLKYTCSAGLARNKMVAKLGSGHKKPNQQTVIRNRAVNQFLRDFKVTKIRNLGGKFGDQVVSTFGTESIGELLEVSMEQLKLKLGDDSGSWLWHILRGEDHSEVNSRTEIKSMLSAKSFKPSINSSGQAVRWLRIFVADIFSRLVEEGVLEHKRRPKTLNLHYRQSGTTRSRQLPIPPGKKMDEQSLFELANTLLGQIIVGGRAWPCSNLSLSVGGFEDGPSGTREIGSFFVKGHEPQPSTGAPHLEADHQEPDERAEKRQRTETGEIQRFFSHAPRLPASDEDEGTGASDGEGLQDKQDASDEEDHNNETLFLSDASERDEPSHSTHGSSSKPPTTQLSLDSFFCARCSVSVPNAERQEHEDWHFAHDLQNSANSAPLKPSATAKPGKPKKGQQKSGKKASVEKGQQRLAFG